MHLRMAFAEDNFEMVTKEVVRLTNNGNATGKFKWLMSASTATKVFSISPEEGNVPSQKYVDCLVVYKPSSI